MDYFMVLPMVIYIFSLRTALGQYRFSPIKTVYIPETVNPDVFDYDVGLGEQMAVNDDYPFLYTIGNNLLHVIDFSNVTAANIVYSFAVKDEGAGELSDVTVCGEFVAVNVDNKTSPLDGKLQLYTRYDPTQTPPMTQLYDFNVGALPDAAVFTSDCQKILVAIEGEVRLVDGKVVDPEGGLTVVELGPDPINIPPVVTFVDLKQFNVREAELRRAGVRKTFDGQGTPDINSTTLSQDLEPENIAIDDTNTYAFVTLQENNAVGIFDIPNKCWIDIKPLGTKNYSGYVKNRFTNKLDPSDRDDGINIRNYPVRGMLQPDGIKFLRLNGKGYLLTANEGDEREFTREDNGLQSDFEEGMRGRTLLNNVNISQYVPQATLDMLADNTLLGRLVISTVDGLDNDGTIREFHIFGGRSFSIFDINTWRMSYDSGKDLAFRIAVNFPGEFNAGHNGKDDPDERFDSRSDARGCEPESIETGQINGVTLIFVGLERPGMIAMYTVEKHPWQRRLIVTFQDIYYGGGFGKSFNELYDDRVAHALDVEDIRFIDATKSPTGRPLFIAAGSVSGTITFFDILCGI